MSVARITVPHLKASDMTGPKAEDLAQRRQLLKAKRKTKFYKMAWRTFLTTLLAVGTVKLATSPIWLIRSHEQIDVNDNQLLPSESIRTLASVPYPQSLVSIQPEELANRLADYPPIEAAIVRRRLIPPRLQVQVIEKVPVAITLPKALPTAATQTTQASQDSSTEVIPFEQPGLLDAKGYWMPRDSFSDLGGIAEPALQVIGIRAEDITAWANIYQRIARSPVNITVLDWSNQNNLILHSDLGKVHLGPYSDQFAAQLSALDQLRSIHEQTPPEEIAFIQLQDPSNPIVEVLPVANNNAPSDRLTAAPAEPALHSP